MSHVKPEEIFDPGIRAEAAARLKATAEELRESCLSRWNTIAAWKQGLSPAWKAFFEGSGSVPSADLPGRKLIKTALLKIELDFMEREKRLKFSDRLRFVYTCQSAGESGADVFYRRMAQTLNCRIGEIRLLFTFIARGFEPLPAPSPEDLLPALRAPMP